MRLSKQSDSPAWGTKTRLSLWVSLATEGLTQPTGNSETLPRSKWRQQRMEEAKGADVSSISTTHESTRQLLHMYRANERTPRPGRLTPIPCKKTPVVTASQNTLTADLNCAKRESTQASR